MPSHKTPQHGPADVAFVAVTSNTHEGLFGNDPARGLDSKASRRFDFNFCRGRRRDNIGEAVRGSEAKGGEARLGDTPVSLCLWNGGALCFGHRA